MQQVLFDFRVRVHGQGQLAVGLGETPGAMEINAAAGCPGCGRSRPADVWRANSWIAPAPASAFRGPGCGPSSHTTSPSGWRASAGWGSGPARHAAWPRRRSLPGRRGRSGTGARSGPSPACWSPARGTRDRRPGVRTDPAAALPWSGAGTRRRTKRNRYEAAQRAGFQSLSEVGAVLIQGAPALARLDSVLERRKAFERHTDRALDAVQVHEGQRGLTEEGAVQPGLEHGARQFVAGAIEDAHHEPMGVLAVVDVAGPVQDIEELPGLGDGAKQVIVAARPFLLGVVADGGPFGMTAGGRDRAVEVEGQAACSPARG